ncbi:hypothetical protein ScPMuIL_008289 [Solemya velum]
MNDVDLILTGGIPNEKEGIVRRSVCSGFTYCDCADRIDIEVKNCGLFLIYKLQPIQTGAYCFGGPLTQNVADSDPCQTISSLWNDYYDVSLSSHCYHTYGYGYWSGQYILEKWYGHYKYDLSTKPTHLEDCIRFPAWMNGTIPDADDGIVQRTVCYMDSWTQFDSCQHSVQIQVKNCGKYRVYKLKPFCLHGVGEAFYSWSKASGDPCMTTNNLYLDGRLIDGTFRHGPVYTICDNYLCYDEERCWLRISHYYDESHRADIITSPPDANHGCRTTFPVWMNGWY